MKILDFNENLGDRIFTTAIVNESIHQVSNQNSVTAVNFVISKNLVVKSTMLPHRDSHTLGPFLM